MKKKDFEVLIKKLTFEFEIMLHFSGCCKVWNSNFLLIWPRSMIHFLSNLSIFTFFCTVLNISLFHLLSSNEQKENVKEKGHISNENFQLVSEEVLTRDQVSYWRKEPTSTSVRTIPRKNLLILWELLFCSDGSGLP